jgi:anti-sigma factor RsiW
MNHPSEQLADLVDGTLGADERARVEAHLAGCATCREDVAAATAARRELRALPRVDPPADLHDRVVAAAGGGVAGGTRPTWHRWAGVAAAAAVVVAIALALPGVGDGGNVERAAEDSVVSVDAPAAEGGAEAAGAQDAVPLEVQSQDYDEPALQQLAEDAGRKRATLSAGESAFDAASSETAVNCIRRASTDLVSGRLTQLIQARFLGRPAYIAVYVEGPGAGQRLDRSSVWVASTDDCSLLSTAGARL